MKKYLLSFLFLGLITHSIYAQTEQKQPSNFSLGLNFSLGNSLLNTEGYKNLEGSVFGAELDASYDLIPKNDASIFWRFGLGLETATYNANLFTGIGQSNLQAEYLRVPLKVSAVYRLGRDEANALSNTKFIAGIGGFLNYVYTYEVNNIENTTDIDDVDLGFGFLFNLGLEQDVSTKFSISLGLDYSLMGEKNERDQLNFNTTTFYIGTRYRL